VYPWHFDHMRYLNVTWYIGKLMKPASSCSRWSVSIHRGVHKAEPAKLAGRRQDLIRLSFKNDA
jgi:hypothetical protein